MAFNVGGDAYGRFMGRFSEFLSAPFADFAGVSAWSGLRVLDVGCGPGALSAELVERVGAARVSGIDPSAPFVAAARERLPDVDIREGPAEELPWGTAMFDVAMAQLVVQFMSDPARGVGEMARVVVPGGVVAACVWDHAGGRGPLSPFWQAASDIDPDVADESRLTGTSQGDLEGLLRSAALDDVVETALTVTRPFATFEDWWTPFTLGVGPAGDHVNSLDETGRQRLEDRCREILPEPPFTLDATAWAARGRKPGTSLT